MRVPVLDRMLHLAVVLCESEGGLFADARSSAKPAMRGLLSRVVASMIAALWLLWLDFDR
jgi:hypothetical protein